MTQGRSYTVRRAAVSWRHRLALPWLVFLLEQAMTNQLMDAAFGDFNGPLLDNFSDEDERDAEDVRLAHAAGEFTPYEDFRRDELGL